MYVSVHPLHSLGQAHTKSNSHHLLFQHCWSWYGFYPGCGTIRSHHLFYWREKHQRKATWVPQPRRVNLQNHWNCTTDQQITDGDTGHAWMHVQMNEPPRMGNWGTHLKVGRPLFWSPDEVRKQSYEQQQEPSYFSYPSWKPKQNFTHWKKSLMHKGVGSSPAIVLLPCSKKQMWIWREETDNWINLSQKSAIHLLSKECRSLMPVSGFHSETQTSAVYQSCLLDVICPLTRPTTVFHTAAFPSS